MVPAKTVSKASTDSAAFQLQSPLGSGGMGEVYLASVEGHSRALKFLNPGLGAGAVEFFTGEVRLLSRLSHPHLVQVFDFFAPGAQARLSSGDISIDTKRLSRSPFFVMEYLQGHSFEKLAPRLEFPRLLSLFIQVMQGLYYLHSRNILHRDLKPSNLWLLPDGQVKILDFNLSLSLDQPASPGPAIGTIAFMPPEAFAGEASAAGDLFSAGVVFYQALAGRLPFAQPLIGQAAAEAIAPPLSGLRPDVPEYFTTLIHRLLRLKAVERPSTLGVLKYLQQHVESDLPIVPEGASEAILQKVPLVGRASELEAAIRLDAQLSPDLPPRFLEITGPMGVGRSRLTEELKWQLQLKGRRFLTLGPAQASQWILRLCELAGGAPLEPSTPLRQFQNLLKNPPSTPLALAFTDLQDWPEAELKDLSTLLAWTASKPLPWLIVMEWRNEPPGNAAETALSALRESAKISTLQLVDLAPEQARKWVDLATVDRPLASGAAARIAKETGGRPLLLSEAVQWEWEGGQRPRRAELEEITRLRVAALSEATQDFLAALCSHPIAPSIEEIAALASENFKDLEARLVELDQRGFLLPRDPKNPRLQLSHPSLRGRYAEALGPRIAAAHRLWLAALLEKIGDFPDKVAVVAGHARGAQDEAQTREWGLKAAESALAKGDLLAALDWFEHLAQGAKTAEAKVYLYAHLAPVYFRLGRFDEALQSYDRWFKHRVDDETRLQKVKHLYYTGLVLFTAGDLAEAQLRLQSCLSASDSARHPAHRPYHARAHCILARLMETEYQIDEARRHLLKAVELAGEDNLLLGEAQQGLGRLEQSVLGYEAAARHYGLSHRLYEKAGDRSAQLLPLYALGTLRHECGDLAGAVKYDRAAIDMALQLGELLQWARCSENLGIALMELGDYGGARTAFEETDEVLRILAKPEDRELMQFHRAELYFFMGHFERGQKIFDALQGQKSFAHPDMPSMLALLAAESALLQEDDKRAGAKFTEVLRLESGRPPNYRALSALLGIYRVQALHEALRGNDARLLALLEILESLPFPLFQFWGDLFRFLLVPLQDLTPAKIEDFCRTLEAHEGLERRREAFILLALHLERQGLGEIARMFLKKAGQVLHAMLSNLPEENQMDFEKNRDLKSIEKAFQKALTEEDTGSPPPSGPKPRISAEPPQPSPSPGISEARFRQYSLINRYISQNRPLGDILERVMDAAIELSGAERGFLILKNPKAKDTPLAGYEVKAARHLSQRSLSQKEFHFSLSAVKQTLAQGSYLISDNAQMDERLQTQKSVVMYQLKSIFVLPLEAENESMGALYLDHPYRQACFSEESVALLSALASQAALAIQKAQLVEDLQRSQEKLKAQVQDQAERLEAMSEELLLVRSSLRYGYEEIVGRSPAIMKVFERLDHVTETAIPVWILGESGTGKEMIARSLHTNSPRKKGPFVAENCGAIPETLLESELFGHKRGAFTHADRDRVGLLEQASGGTLFLDEVADMSLGMQAKLLRVLQEGEVRPLGGNRTVKIDVRLVTASNRDLASLVKEGKFRQDLFFRINGLAIRLPPLRERKEDIPLLAEHFMRKFSKELGLKGGELSEEALQLLIRHPWPGNIRELEGVLRTALLFAKGKIIQATHLSFEFAASVAVSPQTGAGSSRSKPEEDSEERQMILEALRQCDLDKDAAAKKLGMGLRTLYTRMGALGIPKKKTLLSKYLGV